MKAGQFFRRRCLLIATLRGLMIRASMTIPTRSFTVHLHHLAAASKVVKREDVPPRWNGYSWRSGPAADPSIGVRGRRWMRCALTPTGTVSRRALAR